MHWNYLEIMELLMIVGACIASFLLSYIPIEKVEKTLYKVISVFASPIMFSLLFAVPAPLLFSKNSILSRPDTLFIVTYISGVAGSVYYWIKGELF